MTRKLLLLLAVAMAALLPCRAADQPTVSTDEATVWYVVQFLNGECALEAKGDGAQVLTAMVDGSDDQLWKVEGDATQGYTLTSKSGLRLYTSTTVRDGKFYAASAPAQNDRFTWTTTTNTTYSDGFVLSPKANSSVYMNQWGGAGSDRELGLWNDRSDANQPFRFVEATSLPGADQTLDLIPYPRQLTLQEGTLAVSELTAIGHADEATARYAASFAEQLRLTAGISLATTDAQPSGKAIRMATDATLPHEAYRLSVGAEGVDITAADSAGFFYALQTLRQLMPRAFYGHEAAPEGTEWTLPCLDIEDEPQLTHRGFMLDVARHFFSKAEVKRVLDIMAAYKLNRLHWHLTDDQGWRVEIPEWPKLTEVGSIRKGSLTNAGGSTKFYDDTEYGRGCWFTLDDLREVVAYAKGLNIEILPEIDLPGHMVAAITAYPELSCDPTKTYEVRQDSGISEDVLNVGSDEVIDFLKCVLGHIADVFPYPYLHIGGDECPTGQWQTNADCLRRVSDEGLSSVEELQSWLVEELGTWLKEEKGKDIVVWDELLTHWSADNSVKPVIMAWNNISKSADAAAKGFSSIVCPYQNVYLDFMQVSVAERDINEPYQGGWGDSYVNTVQSVYSLNPTSALTGREEYCMGAQGNMWTETCSDSLQLEYQMLPRLAALSETAWLPSAEKSWAGFRRRLQTHDDIYTLMGYRYAPHYFDRPELTEAEQTLAEAAIIIAAARPGQPGHPDSDALEALTSAHDALAAQPDDDTLAAALASALAAYKAAPIALPEADKYYKLTSASTYYNARYEGSTAYADGQNVRFHYTPQTEPEELWQFIPADGGGYLLTSDLDGTQVTLATTNGQNVTLTTEGTPLRVDLATEASAQYTYVPGAVNLTATESYSGNNPRRLWAEADGYVKTDDNGALCYPGTWRIEEVTDWSARLEGLIDKCQLVLLTATPGAEGEPTQEALDFLANQLIAPAEAELQAGPVSRETYERYAALYAEYLTMFDTTVLGRIDEGYWYYIQEAYPDFSSAYAAADASTNRVMSRTLTEGDEAYMWRFEKHDDGTVAIYNRLTQTPAYPASQTDQAAVMLGQAHSWTLDEFTTEGNTGIRIIGSAGTHAWYTNPNAWANVIMQPKQYGACIWTLHKLSIPTGIATATTGEPTAESWYDLSGRRVSNPGRGVYITSGGRKVIRR